MAKIMYWSGLPFWLGGHWRFVDMAFATIIKNRSQYTHVNLHAGHGHFYITEPLSLWTMHLLQTWMRTAAEFDPSNGHMPAVLLIKMITTGPPSSAYAPLSDKKNFELLLGSSTRRRGGDNDDWRGGDCNYSQRTVAAGISLKLF